MLQIADDDIKLQYPGFYNIYSIKNEISIHALRSSIADSATFADQFLDDEYGRVLKSGIPAPYGASHSLNYYVSDFAADIVDVLRVPFRKIPIFKFTSIPKILQLIQHLEKANPGYSILLRGQAKFYPLKRNPEDHRFLYGEETLKEPSFHPSFLRSNFNEYFIYNLWHSQIALMLNDVGIDLSPTLTAANRQAYNKDVMKIKGSPHFTPLALGTAQHYGLPSIGLDLTKDIKVASWFASHQMSIGDQGNTIVHPIMDFKESTIYIFRCPNDAVFSHEQIKPKFLQNTRPDRQDAWFSHTGWGFAKNQLAGYLMAGIRLDKTILDLFEDGYDQYLFPNRSDDLILNFFLNIRENGKYMGEVKRALERIYLLDKSNCRLSR